LAQVFGNNGQFDEALAVLDESLALSEETGEHFWEAEIVRLRGDLLVAQQRAPEAEPAYQQALALARRQQAKSLELRAALSLSRLWLVQGKRGAAHDLLAPLYARFSEGYDSADLLDAAALLDTLPT
jgi:predicted ATPase